MVSAHPAASRQPPDPAMTTAKPHRRQKREIATSFLKGLDLLTLLAGMLGLSGMRTAEKFRGVATR